MKAYIAAFLIISAVFNAQGSEATAPPNLSLVEATRIAQDAIESLNLPKDHLLRLVAFRPASKEYQYDHYNAYFDPQPNIVRARLGEPPTPRSLSYIRINMDGSATLVDELRARPNGELIQKIEKEL